MRAITRWALCALTIGLLHAPTAPAETLGSWTLGPATTGDWANDGVAGAQGHLYTVTFGGAELASILPDGSVGAWAPAVSPNLARVAAITLAAGNRLYIAGGHTGTDGSAATATVEVATIAADGSLSPWAYTSSMTIPRTNHAGAVGAGRLYMLTNYGGSATVESTAILVDGTLGPWRAEASMNRVRQRPGAAVVNSFLYVIGGLPFTTTVERAPIGADGVLGAWEYVASTQKARYALGAASIGSLLFAIGGYNDAEGPFASVEVSDFPGNGSGSWSFASSMNHPRTSANATAIGSFLYVVGCGASIPQCVVSDSDNTVEFAPLMPLDADGDGVRDEQEPCFCLGTAPSVPATTKGCSVDQLCPCAAPLGRSAWNDHREYVACVRAAVDALTAAGAMSREQGRTVVRAAAESGCGS